MGPTRYRSAQEIFIMPVASNGQNKNNNSIALPTMAAARRGSETLGIQTNHNQVSSSSGSRTAGPTEILSVTRNRSKSEDFDLVGRTTFAGHRIPLASTGSTNATTGRGSLVPGQHMDQLSLLVHSAIRKGNLDLLKKVFKNKKVILMDRNRNSPLHMAARQGHVTIIKWLLKTSCIPVTLRNSRQETCAHHAAKLGHLGALKVILYSGAAKPLALALGRECNGMTILHLATISGHDVIVTWLVETFGRSIGLVQNNASQTALHLAAARGHEKCVLALCRLGRQLVNSRDHIGATAAFYACQEGRRDVLALLLNAGKAELWLTKDDGITPVMTAAQAGRLAVVQFIKQREGDLRLEQRAHDGATIFHMAAANGHVDVICYLLAQRGAEKAVRLIADRGSSPAHDAAQYGHTDCLRHLVESGLDPHLKDADGDSPYTLALRSRSAECARYAGSLAHGEGESGDPGDIYGSVQSMLIADKRNSNIPVHDLSTNHQLETKTHKKKTLLFRKNKKNEGEGRGAPGSVVRGEFLLRVESDNGLTAREKRLYQPKDNVMMNQKFRSGPMTFPAVTFTDSQRSDSDDDSTYPESSMGVSVTAKSSRGSLFRKKKAATPSTSGIAPDATTNRKHSTYYRHISQNHLWSVDDGCRTPTYDHRWRESYDELSRITGQDAEIHGRSGSGAYRERRASWNHRQDPPPDYAPVKKTKSMDNLDRRDNPGNPFDNPGAKGGSHPEDINGNDISGVNHKYVQSIEIKGRGAVINEEPKLALPERASVPGGSGDPGGSEGDPNEVIYATIHRSASDERLDSDLFMVDSFTDRCGRRVDSSKYSFRISGNDLEDAKHADSDGKTIGTPPGTPPPPKPPRRNPRSLDSRPKSRDSCSLETVPEEIGHNHIPRGKDPPAPSPPEIETEQIYGNYKSVTSGADGRTAIWGCSVPPPPPVPPPPSPIPAGPQSLSLGALLQSNRPKLKSVSRREDRRRPSLEEYPEFASDGRPLSRVEQMKAVLERKGIMVPYVKHLISNQIPTDTDPDPSSDPETVLGSDRFQRRGSFDQECLLPRRDSQSMYSERHTDHHDTHPTEMPRPPTRREPHIYRQKEQNGRNAPGRDARCSEAEFFIQFGSVKL